VSAREFFTGLSSYGLNVTKEEAVLLCKFYDKDNTEMINFEEFLFAIRGKPNEERQAVIDLVYYKFDKSRSGYAEATELRKVFNCVKHPRYLMGEYTEDQIFYLYLKNFSNQVNGTVTKKVIFYLF
jgi:Ca2+-binding EF-hand superfamily protein